MEPYEPHWPWQSLWPVVNDSRHRRMDSPQGQAQPAVLQPESTR